MRPREALRYDVPTGVFAGIVALLVALFLPLSHRTPAWPTELAHLTYDERAVLDAHRRDLARPAPAAEREVMRAWAWWSRSAVSGDAARLADARQRFQEVLDEATGHAREPALALRARATERFLANLNDARAPLTEIARRHGLGPDGPWYATRAARIAWFAMRWERNAARAADDGRVEPLTDTLLRVDPAYQRAFVSWGLDARCPALIGAHGAWSLTAAHTRACAAFRNELVPVARAADPRYPDDEARAAIDVMLAVGLRRAPGGDDAVHVVDDAASAGADGDAQAALVRARDRYAAMLERERTPRIERHFMAVVTELGRE